MILRRTACVLAGAGTPRQRRGHTIHSSTSEPMQMPREVRFVGYLAAGLLAARIVVLALDAIAEAVERRTLYR